MTIIQKQYNMKFQQAIFVFITFLLLVSPAFNGEISAQKKVKNHKDDKTEQLSDFNIKERKAAFMEANKQKLLENYEAAAENYLKALKIDPGHDASMYELARIYLRQNRTDDGIILIEQAIAINDSNSWYYILLAEMYKQTRQYDKVVEVFEKLSNKFPENIEYRYDLALTYIITGDYKKAIDTYNNLEGVIGVTEDISLKKRNLWNNLDKPGKALNEIEKLVDAYPYNSRYLQILAESYVDMENYDKALENYLKVLEIDPDDPYIHISLSDLYRKKGEDEKACDELKLGFANPGLDLDSKIQILITYYSFDQLFNDNNGPALELAEILNKTHPGDPRSLSLYSDLLYRSGKLPEALETINEVLKVDSSNYSIWEQKMFIENELKQNEQLIETSRIVSELFPMQPLPYLFGGFASYQQKKYEDARKSLETGSKLVVGNDRLQAQFYSTLGDIYNQLEDHNKSDENYDKALKITPDDAYVLNNYSYFLSLRSTNLEKAKQMAARATEIDPDSPSFMDTYGWVLYKLGEYEEAEVWVKKSIDHPEEDSAVVLEHYGDILYKLDRKNEALEYWQKAMDTGQEASEFLEKKIKDQTLYE
ncbi:MAG: tetratricopeptide repeat protein [Bacteroidales bacterium]|nr:tetratricopeptide repeat protein [Bacteroidales bacterium]